MILALLALACKSGSPADDTAAACAGAYAVVSTASDDYSVGALATVCLDDRRVQDSLASVSGDAQVSVQEGAVWVLNRSNQNSLRRYTPGDWTAPVWEVSTGVGSNPQSVAVCGGVVWVSRWESNQLLQLDPATGDTLGELDLGVLADADGLAELGGLVADGDRLLVAAQQLDRDNDHLPAGGEVVALDCASGDVLQGWTPGPNPTISSAGPGQVLVRTGVYYDAEGAFALDGAVRQLDLNTGVLSEPLVEEVAVQRNIGAAAVAGGGLVTLSADEDWSYHIGCGAVGGAQSDVLDTTAFLVDADANGLGEVWVASRTSWADASAPGLVTIVNASGCAVEDDRLEFALDPYDVAFYEP